MMLEVQRPARLLRQEPHPARRRSRRGRGRDRQPARAQRRRPLDHLQGDHGPGGRRRARCAIAAATSPACAPISSRTPASATCRRTGRSFPTLTVRQNLELGLKRAGVFGRWNFDDVFALFPNLRERADNAGRRAVGRRAADADDVPHADGRSRPDPHRRAHRGPGAAPGRAGRRRCSPKSPGAASRSCWSSRSSPSRSRSRSGST